MRRIIAGIALLIAGAFAGALLARFVEHWLTAKLQAEGYYDDPPGWWLRQVSWLFAISDAPWFPWAAGSAFGFCAGVWLDWLLRPLKPSNSAPETIERPPVAAGRCLSKAQKTEIAQALSKDSTSKVTEIVRDDGEECANFAEDLADAFRQSGAWVSDEKSFFGSGRRVIDIFAFRGVQGEDATRLADIFRSSGFMCEIKHVDSPPKEHEAPFKVGVNTRER